MLGRLKEGGIKTEFITLHVGLGTFLPVKEDKIERHKMHSEWSEISPAVARRLNAAKAAGCRIIAVGTTAARTLEAFSQKNALISGKRWIDIFIRPGYKFKFIDGLITNFHLPCSTLLMMITAFAGSETIKKAYKKAIEEKYRFFSFGDAMFIS